MPQFPPTSPYLGTRSTSCLRAWLALGALATAAISGACSSEHKDGAGSGSDAQPTASDAQPTASAAAAAAAEASGSITCRNKAGVTPWSSKLTIKGASTSWTFVGVQPPGATAPADVGPAQGKNTFVLEVKDAAGAPVKVGSVELVSTMPEHGHPPPPAVSGRIMEGGSLTLPNVDLFMSGLWKLTFNIVRTGVPSDTAEVSICIEG